MWRLRPDVIAGAMWALLAVFLAKRRLAQNGLSARVLAPRWLPSTGSRGVTAVLHKLSPTCLERALVAQAWRAAHGDLRDIVIGIPIFGMKDSTAHAWLDGTDAQSTHEYREIHRLHAPSAGSGSVRVNESAYETSRSIHKAL